MKIFFLYFFILFIKMLVVDILLLFKLQKMTKKQQKGSKGEKDDKKNNKGHKTLRQKLRKKRQQIKKHKKQKSQQKKQYNPQLQKQKYFSQGQIKDDNSKELKMKKINKHIQKFINIYEDDLNDFYQMFKTFDDKGFVNISQLQNKSLFKCLKKLFKYLPLNREKKQYRKVETSKLCLERFMKQKVSQAVENYLQHGSNQEIDNQESSEDDDNKQQKQKNKNKKHGKKHELQQQPGQEIRLYKDTVQENTSNIGPYIPPQIREQMAILFEKQLQQRRKQKQQAVADQQNQFSRIFSMGKTKKEIKESKYLKPTQAFPQHLMAKGSALLGQKMVIDDNEIQQYNKIHRPKKLIEMHKELRQNMIGQDTSQRKGFNRERDMNGSGKMSLMQNSAFFDFKSRMSKPQQTNQFL